MDDNENNAISAYHEENFKKKSRYVFVFALLVFALLLITVLNINTGNVDIPVGRIFRIILFKDGAVDEVNIVWKIRMPRIIMAAVLGGALALSGFLLQTFFENPKDAGSLGQYGKRLEKEKK